MNEEVLVSFLPTEILFNHYIILAVLFLRLIYSTHTELINNKKNVHHYFSHSLFKTSLIASGSIDNLDTLLSTMLSASSFIAFL